MALASQDSVGPATTAGRHEQLSEMVARTVREAIMVGELTAPSYLRTEKLAAELGVSPTPVREALMILHAEGTVRWEPRRGYRVAPLTRQDVSDLFAVQAHIAGELAARAALVIDADEVDRLEAVQGDLEVAAADGDADQVDVLNHEIHRSINAAADSPRLAVLLQQTVHYVPRGFFGHVHGWADASSHEHGDILTALRASDAGAAREAMTSHITHIGALLVEHLTARGSFDRPTAAT